MTTWTKFSERLPEESVEAVHVQVSPTKSVIWTRRDTKNGTWKDYAYACEMWHPITYPELPREETQEERDAGAFLAWSVEQDCYDRTLENAFLSALRYERAEVAKLVDDLLISSEAKNDNAIRGLRKRCGLNK